MALARRDMLCAWPAAQTDPFEGEHASPAGAVTPVWGFPSAEETPCFCSLRDTWRSLRVTAIVGWAEDQGLTLNVSLLVTCLSWGGACVCALVPVSGQR